MKKTIFVLSAFFLVVSPVLAGGLEEDFLPADQGLTLNQESKGVVFASDYQEVVNEDQEPGILGKIGGLASNTLNTAQRFVETPFKVSFKVFGQIFGRNNTADTAKETLKPEAPKSDEWVKLDPESVPDFSLKMKLDPGGYSVFEKSEGRRLANMSTAEKKGLGNRMLKVQILLQDIVSTDEQ